MSKKLAVSMVCFLAALPFAFSQNAASVYPPQEVLNRIRAEGIRAHMNYLADDLLEGRGTGTRGYMLAAKYVATQFEEMGLKPAGENGSYFQNIRFRQIDLIPEKSSVVVQQGGQSRALRLDTDYVSSGDAQRADAQVEAPVVFVGYGVTAPEFQHDDYAGLDVKGKIVAFFYGAPASFPSAPLAHYSTSKGKAANAAAHGAIGMIAIWAGPITARVPFSRVVHYAHGLNMRWLDEKGVINDAHPEIRAAVALSEDAAAALFAGAPKTFDQALQVSAANKPQGFPLQASVALRIVSKFSEVESPNIAAILPGSDPELKNQYVVYSAHCDHMGIGEPKNGDTIYNGALDNASGTSAVLEIAHVLSEMPKAPRRSFLFLIVAGEEEGLLGSDYYAQHPTVPMAQVAANINMDEIPFLYEFRDAVGLGAEHSTIEKPLEDVAKHMGLELSPDPQPEEVYFVRSDQYSFVKQGVPSIDVIEGFKAVDASIDGKKVSEAWEEKYYHSPQDDMKQKLNFDAAVKATRLNLALGYELAQQEERPRWNENDFFERFAKK